MIDDIGLARIVRAHGFSSRSVNADEMIRIRMYRGLGEIVAGFTKNSYMVFAGSVPRALALFVMVPLTHLAPWVWGWMAASTLVTGELPRGSAVFGATALAIMLLTRHAMFGMLGFSRLAALFTQPLEVVVWLWIFLRSTWKVGVRRRLHWRGRDYPARVTAFGDFAGIRRKARGERR